MVKSRVRQFVLSGLVLTNALPASLAQLPTWHRQFGSSLWEKHSAVAPDGTGGAFQAGYTEGDLAGPSAGGQDAWVARFDGLGHLSFLQQIGTGGEDLAWALAGDGAGGAYVAGGTTGSLGGPNAGGYDLWLARMGADGKQLWMRQVGTQYHEIGTNAAPDGAGGVYVVGNMLNAYFVAHFDGAGNVLWIRQLGTYYEVPWAASADGQGGVYVAGKTDSSYGGPQIGEGDAFLARLDSSGNVTWLVQFGSEQSDQAQALAADGSGGVFVGGDTFGNMAAPSQGNQDVFLAHFDGSGRQTWLQQFGTPEMDYLRAAATDGLGGAYFAGHSLNGFKNWLGHYAGSGAQLSFQYLGGNPALWMHVRGATSDGARGVLLTGTAMASFGGPNAGYWDPWLVRYVAPSAVASNYCTALVSSSGCLPTLTTLGMPTTSNAGTFQVLGSQIEAAKNGLMFFGTTGQANVPFQGGTLCVAGPLYRLGVQLSQGGAKCTGSFAYDLQDLLDHPDGGALLVPGTTVDGQFWFRDPAAPLTVGLTDGLEFTLLP